MVDSEILSTAREYIGKLEPGLLSEALKIRTGDLSSVGSITDIIEGMQWLAGVFSAASTDVKDDIKSMNACFGTLMTALVLKDYVLIADVLEYELHPVVRGWRRML